MNNNKNNKIKLIISLFILISSSILIVGVTNNDASFDVTSTSTVLISFDNFNARLNAGLEKLNIEIMAQYSIIPTITAEVPDILIPVIANLPGVTRIELNQYYQVDVIPNDPDYGQLWGMNKISAPAAWDVQTDASSVVVAVIDTGVQITHPDLAANIWTNPGEIPNNGKDDDGNGFVDDVNGWDFFNKDNSVYDSTADDHGTHVSGTIGGVGNNGIGVTGVSWNVQIMPLKFLGANGGSTADAISAIQYATNNGADIISASWGGGGFSQALKDAIDAFPGLFVAAAGNNGADNDANPHYPSSYTSANIISIASSTSSDGMSSFSNFGANSVDIAAPGSNIYSTWPSNTYNTISGTSMATPHVSGAAALVLANNPSLTTAQLKAKLMDFADPISAFQGKTVSGGRLNVNAAITGTAPPPPPPPPPSVTDTFTGSVSSGSPDQVHYFDVPNAGDISATLSWGTSADLDMYLYAPGANVYGNGWLVRAYTLSNPETLSYAATSTGQYAIRVNYFSGVGSSYSLDVTHPGSSGPDTQPPSQVTGLTTTTVSNSQIDLSWSAATDNVGVTGYNIYRDGGFLTSVTATSYSDTGLAGSTTYSYTVSAVDAAGNEGTQSTASSAITDPNPDTTAPSQVTGLTASAISDTQIDLSWSASTDNVGVTGYNIYRDGAFLTSVTATSYSDTGLSASTTYSYEVSAFDAAGNEGARSTVTSATTSAPPPDTTSPSQVTGLTASTVSDTQIDLSWNAASDNIGVTGYNIYRDGAFLVSVTGTSYSDTGLTGSTTYSYTVSALDAAGNEGARSTVTSATTNAPPDTTAPSQVTGLTASTVSDTQIDLSWNAASDNVGVTGYNIYRDGTFLVSVTGTSYSDTGLTGATTYSYTVSAVDAAGNEGTQSNAASATTNAPPPPASAGVSLDSHSETVDKYKADKRKVKISSRMSGTVTGNPTNIVVSFDFPSSWGFKKIKKATLDVNGQQYDLVDQVTRSGNTLSLDISAYLADGDTFNLRIQSEWKNVNPGTYTIVGSLSFFDGIANRVTSDSKTVSL